MSESTPQQRVNWKPFECNEHAMKIISFGPDEINVAPPTIDAWRALALVLEAHGYQIRTADTDSYNCRAITGGTEKSLHAYGIALDINWTTNPFKTTSDKRKVRFSSQPTQQLRALDVKRDLADTDMIPAMIEDALAIKTNGGKRVFEWGGNWNSVKDAMHFEIDVTPEDLATGIDWNSVRGANGRAPVVAELREQTRGTLPLAACDIAMGNFEKVHGLIEKWEGGFSNHPSDRGGPTNMGITQATLAAWRGRAVSIEDVRNLTRDEALQIFRARYWAPVHGDELPLPAAQVAYNTAVLSGPSLAVPILQRALTRQVSGVAVDGRMGPKTIGACVGANQEQLVEDYCTIYESHLRGLPDFGTFGRGWMNRLNDIKQTALDWAKAPDIIIDGLPPGGGVVGPLPDRPFGTQTRDAQQLLVLILMLLREKPMASDPAKPGQGLELLLPLLLQSALTGKQLDLTQIVAMLTTGKPLVTPPPNTVPAPAVQGQPQTTPFAGGDLNTLLLPILYERLTGKPWPGTEQPKTDAPANPNVPVLSRPSVQMSAGALGIVTILQALGQVGLPFNLGGMAGLPPASSTTNGTLATLIPLIVGGIGATGGWGALAGIAARLFGGLLGGIGKKT